MNTPIQEAIDIINAKRRILVDVNAGLSRASESTEGEIEGLRFALKVLTSLKELEKKIIIDTYNSGQDSKWSNSMGLMGDYYFYEIFEK